MLVILVRTLILYIGIVITLRILGKRQLSELEASDLVLTLLIADLAAVPMQDIGTPLLHGVIPIVIMVALELIITYGILKSSKFRSLMCGKPSILIQNGNINQKELRKNSLSVDELIEELRTKNITDISQVKYAILETNGELSTILYAGEAPATANDLKLQKQDHGLPIIVVNDGRVMHANMSIRNVDDTWIWNTIHEAKITDVKDVFLLSVDDLGNVYISKKERKS